MSKFSVQTASNLCSMATKITQEVVNRMLQPNKQTFSGQEMAWFRSLESLKQHATLYVNTGLIKLVSSATNLMSNFDAKALESEEQNGRHSYEVSYTHVPAETFTSVPLR